MQLAGFDDAFRFEYRPYGPFSEDLERAMDLACVFDLVDEVEEKTKWGGLYSIYTAPASDGEERDPDRKSFLKQASSTGAIALELAATAAYLHDEGKATNAWQETQRLKPEKAEGGHLEEAKRGYRKLRALKTPRPLPAIV